MFAIKRHKRHCRSGNIVVLAAVMLTAILGIAALAVDVGYMCAVKCQLQRTADAAALAGASSVYLPTSATMNEVYALAPELSQARYVAQEFARVNQVATKDAYIDLNLSNQLDGDIVLGRLNRYWDSSELLNVNSDMPNSVQVTVCLSDNTQNGSLALFFGRALGVTKASLRATATATVWYPALLPFATSESNWQSLSTGGWGDRYTHDPDSISFGVTSAGDGIPEIVMFPGDWDGKAMPPGNFGIIEVGPSGDVLTNLRRQIDRGPSLADLDYHGGSLASSDSIGGRTGIKSSTKTAMLGGTADGVDFAGMIGQVRTLPVYSDVQGNGENAVYTLSRFVAVRIMAVRIDKRWRTQRYDTEGNEITGIVAQPLTNKSDLLQTRLVR
ncbi:MAG: pilus assembly protein TadG-related protein [Pirellulaceae bacterium]